MYQGFKGISDRTNKLFRRQNERRTNSRRKQSLPVHLRTEQQPVNLFQRAGPTTQCKNGSDVESTENSVRRKYPPPKKTAPRTMPVPLTLESLKYRGWASDQKKNEMYICMNQCYLSTSCGRYSCLGTQILKWNWVETEHFGGGQPIHSACCIKIHSSGEGAKLYSSYC